MAPTPTPTTRVACIGAGTIGASWAAYFLSRGLEVVVSDPAPGAPDLLRRSIERAWPALQRLGAVPEANPAAWRFDPNPVQAVEGVGFVQESAPERYDIKKALLPKLDAVLPPEVVIASSSSGLLISRLAEGCRHPERCVVGHPFNPPHLVPLVEVVGGTTASRATIEAALAFYRSVGKHPIEIRKEVPGHLANRLQAALWREAVHLVAEGVASVADVDAAISEGPGLRWALMGPHATFHLAGGDGGMTHFLHHLLPAMQSWWDDLGTPVVTPAVQARLVEGCARRSAGAAWRNWRPGAMLFSSPCWNCVAAPEHDAAPPRGRRNAVKPVLLITRRLPAAVEARAARDYDARGNPEDTPRHPAELIRLAEGAEALLCCPADRLDAATIAALPEGLLVLGTFSVGTDHIDLAAARARGLPVVNTPDVLSVATAELAFLLILATARRAGEGERLVRAGGWTGWAPTQLLGTQVSGRRLGIFGMGRIGRELARMAAAFGLEVHYRNRTRLPAKLEGGARWHDNDESFLAASEVLSLHAPAGETTRHWLNAGRLALLPSGAVVVNTARGALVEDTALIAALRSGRLAAAGLDVYDGEPAVHPGYLALENVVLLPHLGSATTATREAMGHRVLDGIDAVLAGRKPENLVG